MSDFRKERPLGEPGPDEDDEDICGWSYDHSLDLTGERDGVRVYVCRECGAEIIEEDEP